MRFFLSICMVLCVNCCSSVDKCYGHRTTLVCVMRSNSIRNRKASSQQPYNCCSRCYQVIMRPPQGRCNWYRKMWLYYLLNIIYLRFPRHSREDKNYRSPHSYRDATVRPPHGNLVILLAAEFRPPEKNGVSERFNVKPKHLKDMQCPYSELNFFCHRAVTGDVWLITTANTAQAIFD